MLGSAESWAARAALWAQHRHAEEQYTQQHAYTPPVPFGTGHPPHTGVNATYDHHPNAEQREPEELLNEHLFPPGEDPGLNNPPRHDLVDNIEVAPMEEEKEVEINQISHHQHGGYHHGSYHSDNHGVPHPDNHGIPHLENHGVPHHVAHGEHYGEHGHHHGSHKEHHSDHHGNNHSGGHFMPAFEHDPGHGAPVNNSYQQHSGDPSNDYQQNYNYDQQPLDVHSYADYDHYSQGRHSDSQYQQEPMPLGHHDNQLNNISMAMNQIMPEGMLSRCSLENKQF